MEWNKNIVYSIWIKEFQMLNLKKIEANFS